MWFSRIGLLFLLLAGLQVWHRCRHPLLLELKENEQGLSSSLPELRVLSRRDSGQWVQVDSNTLKPDAFVRLQLAGYSTLEVSAQPGTFPLWPIPGQVLFENPWIYAGLALLAWSWVRPTPEHQPDDLLPAQTQVASYRLLQHLGEGVQAEVFLAESDSGMKVALKLIKQADPEFKKRFEREAELCSRLDHPRVVRTLAWGEFEGRLWMAQSYLPGQTLRGWVNERGLHPSEVRRLLAQLAEGLDYAHRRGVFHRDLKPDNILLNARGQAVIGDFGLARCLDMQTMTRADQVLGSPAYMAPEQIQGQKITSGSCDLYALGVIGFELLVGQPPFGGELMEVLMAHLSTPPPRPSSLREGTPGNLEELILRLLEKDPARRPASAEWVMAALR